MSLEKLIEVAIKQGAIIDQRITFVKTENSGYSAFFKPNVSTEGPLSIEIPNCMIIKTENAYKAFEMVKNVKELNEVSVFKFYVACLLSKNIEDPKFRDYINILPTALEIGSPLTMRKESLYVFENTSLEKEFIEKRKNLLLLDFESVSFLNKHVTFDDFLWSHLIITSRAFPYRIVNPEAKQNSVMLLPIIDLLNHQPNTKVEWSSNSSGNFKISNTETIQPSETAEYEIFNNYGPKGNAELYLGYGFVLHDNEYETLQLSLSLLPSLKDNITKQWNVKLPTIEDYTYTIDSSSEGKFTEKEKIAANIVFMLNKFHPIADGLLEIFCFINKNEDDQGPTLKNTMNGLNQLKQSLELKYSNRLDKMPAYHSDCISEADFNNAKCLRQGQLKIYNMAKNEIKSREKKYLKEYRKFFITVKDIYKKDIEEFSEFVEIMQWDKEINELSKMEMELIFRLWLLKTVNYWNIDTVDDSNFDLKWFFELFTERKGLSNIAYDDKFMTDFYNQIIPTLKRNVPELLKGDSWELSDWLIIDRLVVENSYEKGKTLEPLLIKPLNL